MFIVNSPDRGTKLVELGRRLRDWRRLNHVKQEALAAQLGVSQPTISRWERGEDAPSLAHPTKLKDLMAGSIREQIRFDAFGEPLP